MKKYFNTEGLCIPERHYMVPLNDRLRQIKEKYVERGSYFIINKGRQYGKTTTLRLLARYLKPEYLVVSMDFQGIGTEEFRNEATFSRAFAKLFSRAAKISDMENGNDVCEILASLTDEAPAAGLMDLFERLSRICEMSSKPVVMMIDEVDSASNNQVFLDFLAQLRGCYLDRDNTPIFHSVILAGVYDIKNLKLRLRPEAEHKYNSPWNIAAEFKVNMSFPAAQIEVMLEEYELERHTGADMRGVAEEIYQYTSGHPYLVSAICKQIDEEICGSEAFSNGVEAWTYRGIGEAVSQILDERLPLFDSMIRHLEDYPRMKEMLRLILFQGRRVSYNPDNPAINLAVMFGYAVKRDGCVQVANRIFEMRLYQLFLSEEELTSVIGNEPERDRKQFIREGRLDMERVLERFAANFTDIYGSNEEAFIEAQGRKLFLLYLKPIINGTGNYYIEAQTRDARRTDVIVDYHGEQFIVELKIWHGNEYNERGEAQLIDYLDYYHKDKGYMLSFNFNKKKKVGVKEVRVGDKVIVEAVV